MAAALQAAATTSVAAVRSCFLGGTDSGRQLLASPSSVFVSGVREQYPSGTCPCPDLCFDGQVTEFWNDVVVGLKVVTIGGRMPVAARYIISDGKSHKVRAEG